MKEKQINFMFNFCNHFRLVEITYATSFRHVLRIRRQPFQWTLDHEPLIKVDRRGSKLIEKKAPQGRLRYYMILIL